MATVECSVKIKKEMFMDIPVPERVGEEVDGWQISTNSSVTSLFPYWLINVFFCRAENICPTKYFEEHVTYHIPSKERTENDVTLFVYTSEKVHNFETLS